jgi:predicted TIM-barrel fold metal-dependent hydrolase
VVRDTCSVIDVDTHVVEPPDLWSSRMPRRWGDAIPRVGWDADRREEAWFIAGERLSPVASAAHAGWHEFAPLYPPRWQDAAISTWNVAERLKHMDANGIQAQVLYPNVAVFRSATIQSYADQEFRLELIRAYNDYQTDFCSAAPNRLLAVTSLPFWDLDASLKEMDRCLAAGHRGVVFTQAPDAFGLPHLTDRHWYPLWAAAQERGLSVNFHIASAMVPSPAEEPPAINGRHANDVPRTVGLFMGNVRTLSQIICGGVCHSFPDLQFVSVESGIGWIPFLLESLDWQWRNCGVAREHPEYNLLPSEYFRRQIYGCFWFERDCGVAAISQLGADNVLYETDFPHPTSMTPGPASAAVDPQEYIADALSSLSDSDLRKVLHDNAARLYGVE